MAADVETQSGPGMTTPVLLPNLAEFSKTLERSSDEMPKPVSTTLKRM